MKRTLFLVVVVFLMAGTMVLAKQPDKGGKGAAGNSNIAHLELWEKDPTSWEIVEDGAWGKMKHNLSGPTFDFVFNGHELEPDTEYTLIYYPDPWPGTGLICLGSGTANDGGNVHIQGSVDTGNLPGDDDENDGAKIWLVLSSDVDCDQGEMVGWNPTEYLFEYDLITSTRILATSSSASASWRIRMPSFSSAIGSPSIEPELSRSSIRGTRGSGFSSSTIFANSSVSGIGVCLFFSWCLS